jgi:hypothetical protein
MNAINNNVYAQKRLMIFLRNPSLSMPRRPQVNNCRIKQECQFIGPGIQSAALHPEPATGSQWFFIPANRASIITNFLFQRLKERDLYPAGRECAGIS